MEKWFIKNIRADYKAISKSFGINEVIGKLLVNRGIIDNTLIKSFLNPKFEKMHDSKKMKDAEKASLILKDKIEKKRKIRIIGDYDVDGVISTYLLFTALKRCGADVDYDIPDRVKDGYGINKNIIDKCIMDSVNTIITCDNGISAIEPINYAKEANITVIVTDHHDIPFVENEKGERTFVSSNADAIVNPKQIECAYPFKSLCGAGVVFKLIEILYAEFKIHKEECYNLSQFVAIATVCDVVDLVDENRIFVKNGLELLNNTRNIGLRALIRQTAIDDKKISTYHLGFVIGPCINATGRLDTAKRGLQLLVTENENEAVRLSKELFDFNNERKEMTQKGVESAINIIENTNMTKDKVFVVYVPEVHESIVGIVAGRIREKYNVPTIVLTKTENGAKGSGRSIEGYNMFEELMKCKDILLNFGGHPMAAGLSLEENNINNLREQLNFNTKLTDEDLIPKITLDMGMPLEHISYDFVKDLSILEPFGKANPKPIFGEKKANIVSAKVIGQNHNVLKIKFFSKNRRYIDGIFFGDIEEFQRLVIDRYGTVELNKMYSGIENNVNLDIAFYPDINEYNGNVSVQIVVQYFR
ncbi:single-stranded-DNA-specific exonuclease RecJ [Clostridium felsineum]|uniref:Single-stranded-DNA-specific exonuclease RecJ n=1 Tax=Clostridium felsineum TaxID=36839 RepID=A0A1S8M881_9CLOT|nr:single-stranded-DNA-specific exonuclease RecJ [Clostridium felsineum]MCR3757748.1 single-stranded-DNA-specific exonuclease RecJ [Clostridium felsineum]URZ01004.1 Single-stranded-DNA-specific exonuclease RecJ [Clostridium felsineum]URZ06246.1 Single-stranded-DNA-specific exonuclease RecJ [Clostridium felsineum]URZ11281.1 Single-stranded-DNA-specific exonuclease RecJ [Clostridium felsineum]